MGCSTTKPRSLPSDCWSSRGPRKPQKGFQSARRYVRLARTQQRRSIGSSPRSDLHPRHCHCHVMRDQSSKNTKRFLVSAPLACLALISIHAAFAAETVANYLAATAARAELGKFATGLSADHKQ